MPIFLVYDGGSLVEIYLDAASANAYVQTISDLRNAVHNFTVVQRYAVTLTTATNAAGKQVLTTAQRAQKGIR